MTTTTQTPVDALMALVQNYVASYATWHCERLYGTSGTYTELKWAEVEAAKAAIEASARALAAMPAADDVLPKIANELRIMLGSATELSDGIGDIVGYQIKTGALHRILGLLSGAGHPVAIAAKHQSVSLPIAQQAGGVPAGFLLVPVEPTEDMLRAGRLWDNLHEGMNRDRGHAQASYAAMLAAAPSPSAVLPPDSVKMPTTADEAALMTLLGSAWLKEHAPDRLKPEAVQRPDAKFVNTLIGLLHMVGETGVDSSRRTDAVQRVLSHVFSTKEPSAVQPLSEAQRREIVLRAGDATDGLNQDDFADEIVKMTEAAHGIVTKESST